MSDKNLIQELNEQINVNIEEELELFNETLKLSEEREEKEKKFGKPLTEILGQGRPPIGGLSKASQVHKAGGSIPDIGHGERRATEFDFARPEYGQKQDDIASKLGAGKVGAAPEVGSRAIVSHKGKKYPTKVTYAEDGMYRFEPVIPGKGEPFTANAADLHFFQEKNGVWTVSSYK